MTPPAPDGFIGVFNSVPQLTLADWQTATGQDLNSISADPLFVNPTGTAATLDLHLACGSPAIDRGIAVMGVANDFDNDPRGNPPDIGADETNFIGPMAVSAVSRKMHGSAGDFDVTLPGIEPRSGGATGDYQIVVTFATPVTLGGATVSSGTGSVSSVMGDGTNTITVNLTGVANAQYLTISLGCVSDGMLLGNVPVTLGVLVGDVNASGSVTGADVSLVKSQAGLAPDSTNFRADVIANGAINVSDISQVKATTGSSLPPAAAPTAAGDK